MIFKKPYAFLIKYFKFIHIILVTLMCYLVYRTNLILNFFQEYMNLENIITGVDFTGEVFNTWMFALPFVIIVVLGILLGVMFYKKKPKVYYIYNILVMIGVLIVYNIGYNMIGTLEAQIIETRVLHLIRDVFTILILFQGLGLVLTFVRATGFDIKKFDFTHDLAQLDIAEEDAEEFEVAVDVQTNIWKRDLKKNFRHAKYIYIENKFIINGLILIGFSIICFWLYISLTIYNKTYKQGELFSANEFTMSVNNSYLTRRNYRGKGITDNYLLIVEMNIKANYEELSFNATKAEIKIDDAIYLPNDKYNKYLKDVGEVYNKEIVDTNNFERKLLVYEIPKDKIDSKITFKYLDSFSSNKKMSPKYIRIKLNPYNLDSGILNEIVEINNDINLNELLLDTTTINLSNFEIQERFKIEYRSCYKNECFDLFEYLNPVLNTNYDKILLKIDGKVNIGENLDNDNIKNLYNIINYFGKIKYRKGRKDYYYNLGDFVYPKKAETSDLVYVEIPKEVMQSDEISLILEIRDKSYEYIIKKLN